ncbi:hypothetical protein [Streptomyces sp. NPDC088706]|uniref:hypothetical protein n=1 Tax=Streptomyces sp. NPDC088706 TaxID=3365870 RepID=UPI00380673A2
MSRTRTTALSAVPLVVAGVLATAAAPAGATAAAPAGAAAPHSEPSPSLTCQGRGVDPKALVRAKAETVVDAPLSTVWKLQTDVRR